MDLKDGISVIVTLYNKRDYIKDSIRSAIKQFNKNNYQIIVVDDGSSDGSYEIAKEYLRQHKKIDSLIYTQKNSGPSIAINNALKYVKYTHIKLVDGDDIISPDSLQYMKNQMKINNLDLLYGYWEWDNNPSEFKFKRDKPPSTIMINPLKKFIISGWGGSSNLMVKTSALIGVGGCDDRVFVQDNSLPLRIAGNHLRSLVAKKFSIGESKKTICVGPAQVENRIMDNNGQTLYDLSLATLNYIDGAKDLDIFLRRQALKKIIARCWSWRKRAGKKHFLSKFFIIYLMSKLNYKLKSSLVRYYVLNTWINDEKIRKIPQVDSSTKNILIYVGLDLLGDALLKLPMVITLRSIFPNAKITWYAGKGKSVLNDSLLPLRENLIDKVKDDRPYGSSILDFLKRPLKGKYDVIIDTQNRLLTTLLLKKIKTDVFISSSANYFFSDLVPKNKNIKNLSKKLVGLIELLSPKKLNFTKKLATRESKKIGICPGASVIWKKWMIENYIEIAEFLIHKKLQPVFILGQKETDLYRNLERSHGKRIVLFNSSDPMRTIKMAEGLKMGISNDTGCGHLLSYTGIPILTLFGPTRAEKFSPLGNPKNISISSQEVFKSKDINSIPASLVVKKIKHILGY